MALLAMDQLAWAVAGLRGGFQVGATEDELLSALPEALRQHPEAAMVYGNANLIDEQGAVLGRFPARSTNLKKLLRGSVNIPQQASFFWA